jgi:hypothetical protein
MTSTASSQLSAPVTVDEPARFAESTITFEDTPGIGFSPAA